MTPPPWLYTIGALGLRDPVVPAGASGYCLNLPPAKPFHNVLPGDEFIAECPNTLTKDLVSKRAFRNFLRVGGALSHHLRADPVGNDRAYPERMGLPGAPMCFAQEN